MRSVVLAFGLSLDGYIARANHTYDYLIMPKDFWTKSMAPFFKSVDTAIMGRKTWEIAGQGGSGFTAGMQNYILSRTLPSGKSGYAIVTSQSPKALVAAIRRKPGKDIYLAGGGEVTRDFLKADLVDELFLGLVPTLIGEGIPAFPEGFPQRDFELTECRKWSQDLVGLRYRRKPLAG
jgi:dihydrofolate reductase